MVPLVSVAVLLLVLGVLHTAVGAQPLTCVMPSNSSASGPLILSNSRTDLGSVRMSIGATEVLVFVGGYDGINTMDVLTISATQSPAAQWLPGGAVVLPNLVQMEIPVDLILAYNQSVSYIYSAALGNRGVDVLTLTGNNQPTLEWSTVTLPDDHTWGAVTASTAFGVIAFAGGIGDASYYSARVDFYDVNTGAWTSNLSGLSSGGRYLCNSAATANEWMAFGPGIGYANGNATVTTAVDLYHIPTQSWAPSHPVAGDVRFQPLTLAVLDRFIVFAGGYVGSWMTGKCSASVDVFDTQTMSWSLSALRYGRAAHTGVVWKQYLILGGGYTTATDPTAGGVIEVWNGYTQLWSTPIGALQVLRSHLTALVSDIEGMVYFAGGETALAYCNVIESFPLPSGDH